jgi:ankyrin repeat protein|eukprot:CAMPEP_0181192262 /NCGR_PEP_ID=MMETSP1096-20121128/13189_1 /TAXON_ID=156174 ORGANISM="Chrysochromulina ericina, Strain CCMP281" /NCGR_SAMPLE_ID=MMETSP1096 /ASSEMBLY_ACC=CAM_ASM_000453 /LENGTH=209 /DNA_ID=CAMNT_0023281645 /DNA_START=53 /DNA_END=682 /DNA_ORIENTATION=-
MDRVKGDNIDGYTPLHKAVFHHDVAKVQSLFAEGQVVDVNATCVLKQTPLILCVRHHYEGEADQKKGNEICKVLLENGAIILQNGKLIRDAYGDNPLHLAAMACNVNGPEMMRILVEKIAAETPDKAELTEIISESCENFKNTPLHWATLVGSYEVAKLLIEHGARLGKKNKLKEKVSDYAQKYEHPKIRVIVEEEEEKRAKKREAAAA